MNTKPTWHIEKHDDRPKHCLYVDGQLRGYVLIQGGSSDGGLCPFTLHNPEGKTLAYLEGLKASKQKLIELVGS